MHEEQINEKMAELVEKNEEVNKHKLSIRNN
jgi:hypothetical protein